jgi:CubicO group peptidase (beta-lactamase class C family)
MTKPVTSVAIMMLAEQGKLSIDDPVSKYLAGYDKLQVISKFKAADATYETRPAKTVMTIRHLLSHTSGIGYGFTNPIENALTAKTKKGEWELPLLDDPGTKFNYSASTRVLGFVVEKVTGSNLEAWYQEHIFKPLGMNDTSYAVVAAKQSRLAPQFTRASGKTEPLPRVDVSALTMPIIRGDGGLYSTAEDYAKFVRMLLNGGTLNGRKILSQASVTKMGQNAIGSIFVQLQPDADKQRTRPFPLWRRQGQVRPGIPARGRRPIHKRLPQPGQHELGRHLQHRVLGGPGEAGRRRPHDAAAAVLRRRRDSGAAWIRRDGLQESSVAPGAPRSAQSAIRQREGY